MPFSHGNRELRAKAVAPGLGDCLVEMPHGKFRLIHRCSEHSEHAVDERPMQLPCKGHECLV